MRGKLRVLSRLSAAAACAALVLVAPDGVVGAANLQAPPATLSFNHNGTACQSQPGGYNLDPSPKMSQTGIAFDGSRLYISCWGDTTITAIDPVSGNELQVYHVKGVGYGAKAYGVMQAAVRGARTPAGRPARPGTGPAPSRPRCRPHMR